nr:hypothetical protein [Tanacetum cinerariifolium]
MKTKKVGSIERLASPKPSKPRSFLSRYDSHDVNDRVGKSIQVASKSSVVTTADASDKRQQQQDSTSSTSTLATTITVDGNFDFQNRKDQPKNTPLDRLEVLGMIKKRSKVRKGIVLTEMELVLEQTQQGTSHEVSAETGSMHNLSAITKMILILKKSHHGPIDAMHNPS